MVTGQIIHLHAIFIVMFSYHGLIFQMKPDLKHKTCFKSLLCELVMYVCIIAISAAHNKLRIKAKLIA